MDFHGNGTLIEKTRLNEVMGVQTDFYTFDKFRFMCILSGCDYLPSISGIGLAKANKVFKTARQGDVKQILKKLPTYLKTNIAVDNDYVEGFVRANNTFLYQLVFDPLTRALRPLNAHPPELKDVKLDYAGKFFSRDLAYQIALGNIDIHTNEIIGQFDPDKHNTHTGPVNSKSRHLLSIWDKRYGPRVSSSPCKEIQTIVNNVKGHDKFSDVQNKDVVIKTDSLKKMFTKQHKEVQELVMTNREMASFYTCEEDDENQVRQARKNLMEASDGFASLCEPADDTDKHFITSESNDQEDASNESDNNVENESEGNQLLKNIDASVKSIQYTAANIGEETFKQDSNNGSKENKTSLRISRHRNIFAVTRNNIKNDRVPDVEVKSWYFSNKKESSVPVIKVSPIKVSPVLNCISSPHCKAKKKCENSPASIRTMFEKTVDCQWKTSEVRRKTSHDESEVTQEEAESSSLNKKIKSPAVRGDSDSDIVVLGATEIDGEKKKCQASQNGGSNTQKVKINLRSKLSAFSWSKAGSNDKEGLMSSKKVMPKSFELSNVSKDFTNKPDQTKRKISIEYYTGSSVEPSAKSRKTSCTSPTSCERKSSRKDSSPQNSDSDQDVQEVQYQSYEGFLKSIGTDSFTKLQDESKQSTKSSDLVTCRLSESLDERPYEAALNKKCTRKSFQTQSSLTIDLTKDFQTNVKSTCRVSGLSKCKAKQKSLDTQQPKIQNFFSKYSFERKKTDQVQSTNRQEMSHDVEENDSLICTPDTDMSVVHPDLSQVKRKLSL